MKKTLTLLCFVFCAIGAIAQNNVTVSINTSSRTAAMANGKVSLTINSKGQINLLSYQGKDYLNASAGGNVYFSYNDASGYFELAPDAIRIEKQTEDYAEVVYSRTSGNLLIEQGFIIRKNVDGIYTYITLKGTSTPIKLREMRVVYRVDPKAFDYGYVSERMQGYLPSVAIMKQVDSTPIMDATYQLPDGSVYTKYNWANYIARDTVHGMMSNTEGLWAIPVSQEYVNGGPMRQELTVHATNKTPLVLQMLQGEHFGASAQTYQTGNEKIYGPFFIYLNKGTNHQTMIDDAKKQAAIQEAQWPFQWFQNPLYALNRTTVTGKIKLFGNLSPKNIQVVLAQPGSDIYEQGKEYIFWALTDADGNFSIKNVKPGNYSLYAYATEGEITDEFSMSNVVANGETTSLGDITWLPKKYENKLWQIGENDRLADGYRYSDTLRNYGLYDLPPANLDFVIGTSKADKDWYYAQTKAGKWTVSFDNDKDLSGTAVLTASIAGVANSPTVNILVNGKKVGGWSLSNDASVYRSAVLGGKHTLKTVSFSASLLVKGKNTVQLEMVNPGNRGGVMYDCVKLESGGLTTAVRENKSISEGVKAFNYPNPFSGHTTIELNNPKSQDVTVSIFNIQGEKVEQVYKGWSPAGRRQFEWQPKKSVGPGIYLYQIKSEKGIIFGKMIYTGN